MARNVIKICFFFFCIYDVTNSVLAKVKCIACKHFGDIASVLPLGANAPILVVQCLQ